MKNLSLLIICIAIGQAVISQQTRYYTDSDEKFKEAKEYFQKEKYSLAYPLLKELRQDIRETNKVNQPIVVQEINYYAIVCALKQNEGRAEEEAQQYIDVEKNNARVQMMNYHLAEYYFRTEKFEDAIRYYEQANISNLICKTLQKQNLCSIAFVPRRTILIIWMLIIIMVSLLSEISSMAKHWKVLEL